MASTPRIYVAGDVTTDVLTYKGTRKSWEPIASDETPTDVQHVIGGIGWAYRLLHTWKKANRGRAFNLQAPKKIDRAFQRERKRRNPKVKPRVYYLFSELVDAPATKFLKASETYLRDCSGAEPEFGAVKKASKKIASFARNKDDKQIKMWRCTEELGFGKMKATPIWDRDAPETVEVLYLYDININFRKEAVPSKAVSKCVLLRTVWPFPASEEFGKWIVKKNVGRLCKVVVVWLSHLRLAVGDLAAIDKSNSWERTTYDLIRALCGKSPGLKFLRKFSHVVIEIGTEGALLWQPACNRFVLFFHRQHQEEDTWGFERQGWSPCESGCLETEIAFQVAQQFQGSDPNSDRLTEAIERGIRNGIHATQEMRLLSHRKSKNKKRLQDEISSAAKAVFSKIDSQSSRVVYSTEVAIGVSKDWTIVGNIKTGSEADLACRVAKDGRRELDGMYALTVGKLTTIDRREIEGLRILQRQIRDYEASGRADRPLSVGVFGAPGNGKSFAVQQIARSVYGDDHPFVTYNLSQFTPAEGLTRAFHKIRDVVLKGKTPIVLWDEFEAQGHFWLAKLLAPMQDGEFLEDGQSHPVGKCVFIFAGGIYHSFDQFHQYSESEESKEFKAMDFLSRLSGSLDVSGPNENPESADPAYPLRRALLFRSMLGLGANERLEAEESLLRRVLVDFRYRNGTRSFEKVVSPLKQFVGKKRLSASHLTPHEIITKYVENY